MEKGSFHPSTQELEARVKSIALPNQLPKGMDFSEIPVTAFKSSTLETLISQNEDLMARLSVALRKTSEQEERLSNFERESLTMRTRFETLKEQYLVLQEKDRLSSARTTNLHDDNISLKVQISKLEKKYTDIFLQAQAMQRRLTHLERYRARVKKASQGLRMQLKETKFLRTQVQEGRHQNAQLVQSFETKLLEARKQVENLRDKAAERDHLFEERTQFQNRLVYEQRQNLAYREDMEERLKRLAEENSQMRLEVKEVLIDREAKTQELETLRTEVPNLQLNQSQLNEQVESLQALWSHKQLELEAIIEKNQSLQKLNQNISITLNQQRKELSQANEALNQERYQSEQKIKMLELDIKLLRENLKEEAPAK